MLPPHLEIKRYKTSILEAKHKVAMEGYITDISHNYGKQADNQKDMSVDATMKYIDSEICLDMHYEGCHNNKYSNSIDWNWAKLPEKM